MNIASVMTKDVATCPRSATLADAAKLMWDGDCGMIPVVDADGAPVGIVTDRDICMAAATRDRAPNDIRIAEVIDARGVVSCSPEDGFQDALDAMAEHRVRRLPVIGEDGRLEGVVSLADLIAAATSRGGKQGPSYKGVVTAMQAICEPYEQPADA